ncbi:hypothetical protein AALA24_11200 [Anaerovoracaceae bacterium 42-11]
MNILQTIFREYYEEIIYTLHLRQVELETITRLVDCGQPDSGGTLFCSPIAERSNLFLSTQLP